MSRAARTLRRVDWLADRIGRHKAGESVGVYSVCSAHPTVVQAAIAQAAADGSHVLIEATSNQVDQFGGYTGLRPAEFRDLVVKEPANPTYHYHFGMALMQKGDKPSAKKELEKAIQNNPSKDEVVKIKDLLQKI